MVNVVAPPEVFPVLPLVDCTLVMVAYVLVMNASSVMYAIRRFMVQ